MAKNTAIRYRGVHINIVDTPGHADFGGEVERTLDPGRRRAAPGRRRRGPAAADALRAQEGARGRACRPIVVINKIDRQRRAPAEVLDEVYDLFIDLEAHRGPARVPGALHQRPDGHRAAAKLATSPDARSAPLFETILATDPGAALRAGRGPPVPRAPCSTGTTTSAGSSSAASSTGAIRQADRVAVVHRDGARRARQGHRPLRLRRAQARRDRRGERGRPRRHRRDRRRSRSARPWPTPRHPSRCPLIRIDEPTVSMLFSSNVSPLRRARRARFVTSHPAPRPPRGGSGASTSASASRRRTRPTRSACRDAASSSSRSSSR